MGIYRFLPKLEGSDRVDWIATILFLGFVIVMALIVHFYIL